VRGVDLKLHEYSETQSDDFVIGDLRDPYLYRHVIDRRFDEVYQFAADMGGPGFIFSGENDAQIMYNSATINLNVLDACRKTAGQPHLLLIFSMHISGLQPGIPGCAELRGGFSLPGGS
jgi:nucleoside-diphosphate-sugar epimerase